MLESLSPDKGGPITLDYTATLHYLYSLTDYEREHIAHYDPDTLDLGRVRRTLARLGDPQDQFPTIHIAGTKGKGSVAAICAAVCQAAGLKTGLYTSPHLHTFRERIQINRQLMPHQALVALADECRPLFDQEPELTTFEAITALAFTYFARSGVDIAVIEVGLGGRLDATNVITPLVSVITALSYDHTYLLGDTLAQIAREKGGIIKPSRPTVSEPQAPEALDALEQICAERRSPLTLVGRDWTWRRLGLAADLSNQSFELRHVPAPSDLDGTYTLPLLGAHQLHNAIAAIAALDLTRQDGLPLAAQHIHRGLAQTRWPGRFELLRRHPPLVVDCAHNPDSMSKLIAALQETFDPAQRWAFIIGASNDKDVHGMCRHLAPMAAHLIATQSRHFRAMPAAQVATTAQETFQAIPSPVPVTLAPDVGAALALALSTEAPICVTGSIFAVADAREAWALYTGQHIPETDDTLANGLTVIEPQPTLHS